MTLEDNNSEHLIEAIKGLHEQIRELRADLKRYTEAPKAVDYFTGVAMTNVLAPRSLIVFLSANPTDTPQLRVDAELREIRDELDRSGLRAQFELISHGAVRPKDFSRVLVDRKPHFIHFSGHGSANGSIFLEDDNGQSFVAEPDALGSLFQVAGGSVRCVVLNACFFLAQANAIAAHVPYVIGMQKEIGDDAAIKFATGFYRGIAGGYCVRRAFDLAVVDLKFYNKDQHTTPQILTLSHAVDTD